jgi:hypothetical protein
MRAFNAYVIDEEITLDDFCSLTSDKVGPYTTVIGKRSVNTIFSSGNLRESELKRQEELIKKNKIHIINIVRDGRNVVASMDKSWGYYNPFDWMSCIDQMDKYQGIRLNIRYELLLEVPDLVQMQIGKALHLVPGHIFSKYPEFVPDWIAKDREGNYTLRPIDISKATPDEHTYHKRPNDIAYFEHLLDKLGYSECAE